MTSLVWLPLFLAVFVLLAAPAHAINDPGEMLRNPVLEKRAEAIGSQLRCVVCQNESVEESNAGIARDFRHIIRVKVAEGETNKQIIAWMVARYGDFILLKPPFDPMTYVLWGAPLIALVVGAASVVIVRSRRPAPGPPPLTDAERLRLDELTRPGHPMASLREGSKATDEAIQDPRHDGAGLDRHAASRLAMTAGGSAQSNPQTL